MTGTAHGETAAPRTSRRWRRWAWLPVGAGLLAAVLTVDPDAVGLAGTPGYLHAVSFRGLTALGLLGAAVVGAATLLLPRTGRPWIRLVSTGTLLALALVQGGIVLARGWSAAPDTTTAADLTVVSFNTLHSATTAEQISGLVVAAGADVVALPETPAVTARRAAELLAAQGLRYQVFHGSDGTGPTQTTSLLVAEGLGGYRQVAAPYMMLGAVRVEPVSGDGPVLAAVHPPAPVAAVGYGTWQHYGGIALDQCRNTGNAVVAGDFNTTVDHPAFADLGHCVDAATAAGRGAEGTWPSSLPSALATPIDHVFYTGEQWRVLGTHTERIGGSDHRALVVRLALR
ncbi:endonuclease/exonuclease/phosphatase family protein [Nakamurella alba]|nr:endonuclease/exonuclease/phosphatase family protein [Nakamurella alba]